MLTWDISPEKKITSELLVPNYPKIKKKKKKQKTGPWWQVDYQ